MKMRRKLAALLATVMLVSVMPMTAFAASSDTRLSIASPMKIADGGKVDGVELVIDFKDELKNGKEFNLELTNAKWDGDKYFGTDGTNSFEADVTTPGSIKLTRTTDKIYKATADGDVKGEVRIPLKLHKAEEGELKLKIDSDGTAIANKEFLVAIVGEEDAKATVKVANPKTYVEDQTMDVADITITEPYAGLIDGKSNKKITIKLDDKDFSFVDNKVDVKDADGAVIGRGRTAEVQGIKVFKNLDVQEDSNFSYNSARNELTIDIASMMTDNKSQAGEIKIKGLKVNAARRASKGDVTASINADFLDEETITLAKLSDYSTNLKTDKVEEFTAGNEETVKFTLEQARGTLVNRAGSFIFSEGIEIIELKKVGEIKKSDFTNKSVVEIVDQDKKDKDQNELVIYNMEKAVDGDKIKFEVKVNVPLNFKGDLMVKTDSRAFDNSELKLADVKSRVEVKVDPIHVKAGTKVTKGGKITITETEKGNIERGDLVIQLDEDDRNYGDLEFMNVKDLDIKTTGGIKVDEAEYVNKGTSGAAIKMNVRRPATGDEAGTIEISGFEIKSRYTIVDGTYDIEIGGEALTDIKNQTLKNKKKDTMKVENFLLVGDIARKAVFTIGETEFTVNGKVMNMDAAAYIKDGRTMVPLRYLSYALGIDEEDIKFNSGVVTIFAKDGKVIQVRNNDNNLTVNGMSIPMVAAAEIIEGRTYVPVTEIGGVFGVTGTWDPVAQTATFQ